MNIQPGPELDVQIECLLMNNKVLSWADNDDYWVAKPNEDGKIVASYPLPQYSKTWNGMQLVVQEMQRRGLIVYINFYPDGKAHVQIVDGLETIGDAEEESAPFALAKAVIEALEGQEDET